MHIKLQLKKSAKMVRMGLENLAKEIAEVGRLRLYNAGLEIVREMKVPGSEPTYPIQWDTDKQRKAFFASDGFGAGIPSRRTGNYEKAWQLVSIGDRPTNRGYEVVNTESYSKYIAGNAFGQGQSSIHVGRWKVFRDVVDKVLAKLPAEVLQAMKVVVRKIGFQVK